MTIDRQGNKKLTNKERRFCEEYIIDYNAVRSYYDAGYKAKNDRVAATNSNRTLTKDYIQAYLNKLKKKQSKRTQITADMVLERYAILGLSDIANVCSFDDNKVTLKNSDELPDSVTATIESIDINTKENEFGTSVKKSIKIKPGDRALDMLAKHTGLAHDINFAIAVAARYGFKLVSIKDGRSASEVLNDDTEQYQ